MNKGRVLELTTLEITPETLPVATYVKLVEYMKSENIKKEDLALACKIFLLINDEVISDEESATLNYLDL